MPNNLSVAGRLMEKGFVPAGDLMLNVKAQRYKVKRV
jgi:hypothetical protein